MEQKSIIIIVILSILLIISVLGVNIFYNFTNYIVLIFKYILSFLMDFLGKLSYNTGDLIIGTGDVVIDTSMFGLKIIDGIIQDVGNMFKGQATPVTLGDNKLDMVIQSKGSDKNSNMDDPNPLESSSTLKEHWCLVDIDDGKNKCIKIHDDQKCISEKIFGSLEHCTQINP